MKIAVKRLARGEKGQAMILAVILLLVGGLTVSSLLAYMGTGLLTGRVYERRTAELYAADAGVEDAVWKIQHGVVKLCPADPTHNYTISDANGKNVAVNITPFWGVGNWTFIYRVVSTATGDGSGTQIDAYITGKNRYGDYSDMLGHVLTSPGYFYCPNPPTPCSCEELAELVSPGCNETNGPAWNYTNPWPQLWELKDFYWQQVKDEEPYGSDIIDLNGVSDEVGPLYRDGELRIKNSITTDPPPTLTLTGTLYITGDTKICYNVPQDKDMILDLNGQTIFVASDSTGEGKEALQIGDACIIEGPGTIIAVGDIYFKPKDQLGGDENPIFILSVNGTTKLQPNGDFYGSVAGGVQAELKPGNKIYYSNVGFGDLNFLIGVKKLDYSILSWEVSQL